jgi:hypothetical protein
MKVVKLTSTVREDHERAWKHYGCTLMSDGWCDKRERHLINFLVNSPEGTYLWGQLMHQVRSKINLYLLIYWRKRLMRLGKIRWFMLSQTMGLITRQLVGSSWKGSLHYFGAHVQLIV